MTFPQQNQTVSDQGRGAVVSATNIPLYTGIALGGSQTKKTRGSCANINDVRTKIGFGPLAEDVALALSKRGGPIAFMIHDSVDAKTLSAAALTPPVTGTPPAITVSGLPTDRFKLRVEITKGGARGTAEFRYSLDAWDASIAPFTQSQIRVTAATYAMVNSGLTLAFPMGTYVLGDVYTLACVPQEPGTVDLGDIATALLADTSFNLFLWVLSGAQPDKVTGAAVAAALSGHLTSLASGNRFARAFCDVGSDDTSSNVATQAAAWTSSRICPTYGYEYRPSLIPYEGFSTRKTSCVSTIGVRATGVLISNDLSRTADGPDDGVLSIAFDGNQDQSLDAVKISTMRTWTGKPGFYIANGKLHSGFGSDFTDVQFGRVMDVACWTTSQAQFPFISESLRTLGPTDATPSRPVGSIDARDAKQIEEVVNRALSNALLLPLNARGNPGHVSNVVYTVDLSTDIASTDQLFTRVAVRPLGYSKDIETTLGFSRSV